MRAPERSPGATGFFFHPQTSPAISLSGRPDAGAIPRRNIAILSASLSVRTSPTLHKPRDVASARQRVAAMRNGRIVTIGNGGRRAFNPYTRYTYETRLCQPFSHAPHYTALVQYSSRALATLLSMLRRTFFRRRPTAGDAPHATGAERRHFPRIASFQPSRARTTPPVKRSISEDGRSHPDASAEHEPIRERQEQPVYPQPQDAVPSRSRSRRQLRTQNSSRQTRERRERHWQENDQDRQRSEQGATFLAPRVLEELNKLLDTLNSRELQLSLRVDKADESVTAARAAMRVAPAESREYNGARRRCLLALKHKKTVERSLAVTTEQSDRVLRALGRELSPLAERIGAAVAASQEECDVVAADAAALAANFVDDDADDDQLVKEINDSLHDAAVANNAPPADSADWLADVRASAVTDEPRRNRRDDRTMSGATFADARHAGLETVPEGDQSARYAARERARSAREVVTSPKQHPSTSPRRRKEGKRDR